MYSKPYTGLSYNSPLEFQLQVKTSHRNEPSNKRGGTFIVATKTEKNVNFG